MVFLVYIHANECKLTVFAVSYSPCGVHRGAGKCKFVLTHRVNVVHSSSKAVQILSTPIIIRVDPGGSPSLDEIVIDPTLQKINK